MAATTIGTLSYQILADTTRFSKGMQLTRNEITAAKKAMHESMSDAERYGLALDRLSDLLLKDAINGRQYTAMLNKLNAEYKDLTGETERARQAEEAHNRVQARGKQITDTNRTAIERYNEELRELNILLKQDAISQETFNRAAAKAQGRFNQAFVAGQTARPPAPSLVQTLGLGGVGRTALGVASGMGIATGVAAIGHVMRDTMQVSMDFEQSMSRVSALLQSGKGASDAQVDSLGTLARQLGSETIFTATDAAEAMQFFALAGFNVDKITKSMRPTLELAAAGQMSIAESASIATQVMSGMGIEAEQLGFTVDVLTNAMTSANTDLSQLGDAMRFVGPIAKASGKDITETAAAIQMLSNAGIQGEMAGTSLRGILMKLADPTNEATGTLEDLGVEILDVNGDMRHLADIIDDLNAEFNRLGLGTGERLQRIARIFEARAATGFVELLEQGGDQMRAFIDNLDRIGTAGNVADKQMDNLAGSVEELKGAWQELQLTVTNDKFAFRFGVEAMRFAVQSTSQMLKGDLAGDLSGRSIRDTAMDFLEGAGIIEKRPRLILDKPPAGGDGADATEGMGALTKEQRDLITSGNELLDTLFKEQEHFGKTAHEIELMRLKTEGLGDANANLVKLLEAQLKAVNDLQVAKKQAAERDAEQVRAARELRKFQENLVLDAVKKAKEEAQELQDIATRITDKVNPGVKLGQELFGVQRALDAGLIGNEEAKLFSDDLMKEFGGRFKQQAPSRTAGAALERGSAEAFSAIMKAADRGKKDELPKIAQEHLKVAQQTLEQLRQGAANPVQVVENAF